MRRVPSLTAEPPSLEAWRARNPDDEHLAGTAARDAWKRFRRRRSAYHEVTKALLARQQGLCGYCEQRLSNSDGTPILHAAQVEHVRPKHGGPGRVLDWQNLMLCCNGGTGPHHDDDSLPPPGAETKAKLSCGQAKGERHLEPGCDPRTLPWREPIVTIGLSGRMRARHDACRRAGIDPRALEDTIDRLNLNCERLRMRRRAIALALSKEMRHLWLEALRITTRTETETIAILQHYVGEQLRPDGHGHLRRFWTTERQYRGELAEAWIREHPSELHFEQPP